MKMISPAILVTDETAFVEKISDPGIRCNAELWQLDILDGTMFNQTSWANAKKASAYLPLPDLELHLMIQDPLPVIKEWKKHVPSVRRAIIHAEIDQSLKELVEEIHTLKIEVGIAISPDTAISSIRNILPLVDVVLVMGVHPGKSGQKFIGEAILQRINGLHKDFPLLPISVDGGVTQQNAPSILTAGATQLCASSAIWKSNNPKEAFTALNALL